LDDLCRTAEEFDIVALTVWHLLSWCDGMDWPWLRRTAEEFDIFAAVRHTSSRCGNGRSGRRKI
jgi:hypothetical protein